VLPLGIHHGIQHKVPGYNDVKCVPHCDVYFCFWNASATSVFKKTRGTLIILLLHNTFCLFIGYFVFVINGHIQDVLCVVGIVVRDDFLFLCDQKKFLSTWALFSMAVVLQVFLILVNARH
jgi:hypothetical protein